MLLLIIDFSAASLSDCSITGTKSVEVVEKLIGFCVNGNGEGILFEIDNEIELVGNGDSVPVVLGLETLFILDELIRKGVSADCIAKIGISGFPTIWDWRIGENEFPGLWWLIKTITGVFRETDDDSIFSD